MTQSQSRKFAWRDSNLCEHRSALTRSRAGLTLSSGSCTIFAHMRREDASVEASKLSQEERRFLAHRRIAHLATADSHAVPHVVPVCFVVSEDTLYFTIDEKPKRHPATALKRLRNIAENPSVAVVVDRYAEDWNLLGWVMLHGRAEVLTDGAEHHDAQALLRARYPQLEAMQISRHPVVAVRIDRTASWGNLSAQDVV
jgi:PPOX class probable F420-dependent enzyme